MLFNSFERKKKCSNFMCSFCFEKQQRKRINLKKKIHFFRATPDEEVDTVAKKNDFKSIFTRVHTGGPNTELCHGPNENLLL